MKLFNEVLFWGHGLIIAGALALGLFLPPVAVLILIALHEAQLAVFGGCLVSRAQLATGGLDEDENYLQSLSSRLFGLNITKQSARQMDISIKMAMLSLSLIGATI